VKPHDLKPPPGANKRRKRVGRGEGSGRGKTAGRGTKGTRARGQVHAFFEGGQMPLIRRIPKLKGFNPPHRKVYQPVNLTDLDRFDGSEIGIEEFRAAGVLKGRKTLVKVLGVGEISRKITVRAHAFSATAKEKIETAGGRAEVVESGTKGGRK
jgi:large subunit ribosomal protein L15